MVFYVCRFGALFSCLLRRNLKIQHGGCSEDMMKLQSHVKISSTSSRGPQKKVHYAYKVPSKFCRHSFNAVEVTTGQSLPHPTPEMTLFSMIELEMFPCTDPWGLLIFGG